MLAGDHDRAQKLFLSSSRPMEALHIGGDVYILKGAPLCLRESVPARAH